MELQPFAAHDKVLCRVVGRSLDRCIAAANCDGQSRALAWRRLSSQGRTIASHPFISLLFKLIACRGPWGTAIRRTQQLISAQGQRHSQISDAAVAFGCPSRLVAWQHGAGTEGRWRDASCFRRRLLPLSGLRAQESPRERI